jgi:hypothetical protein
MTMGPLGILISSLDVKVVNLLYRSFGKNSLKSEGFSLTQECLVFYLMSLGG